MSVAVDIFFRMMQLKILYVTDNKVMPLQLLQFPKSPFFGSLIIVPVFQSSGVSSSQNFWKIWHKILGVSCSSAFSISGQTLSLPVAFTFFWVLTALTYASVIWSTLISRSSAASRMQGWVGLNLLEMLLPPLYLLCLDCDDLSICVFQWEVLVRSCISFQLLGYLVE